MPDSILIRPIQQDDFAAWKRLWDGYNAFYGRSEATALPAKVTEARWRSTTRIELTCYLQDLFTVPARRGKGIGRALIEGVYDEARRAGLKRVYWQTHVSNEAGRLLYDKVATHLGFIVYSKDL